MSNIYLSGVGQSKKGGKDQESIQASTTTDPGYPGEVTKAQLNITNESQEVSPFPAADQKAGSFPLNMYPTNSLTPQETNQNPMTLVLRNAQEMSRVQCLTCVDFAAYTKP